MVLTKSNMDYENQVQIELGDIGARAQGYVSITNQHNFKTTFGLKLN